MVFGLHSVDIKASAGAQVFTSTFSAWFVIRPEDKDIQASVGILISGIKSHIPEILMTTGTFFSKCLPI